MNSQAIVVGGGIFGSMAATALESAGYSVKILDCRRDHSGSAPAACLMKPSWMTMLDTKKPLAFLGKHYDLQTVKFTVNNTVSADCMWVRPKTIIRLKEAVDEKVFEVGDGYATTENTTHNGLVVVAAGYWTRKLLRSYENAIEPICGSAVIGTGKVANPTIHVFAPYKQAVWFNRGPNEIWFGDGTSIKKKNFTEEHIQRTAERAKTYAGLEGRSVAGIRPYVKDKLGLYAKLSPKLYVLSGGAKNGTILAANHCVRLLNDL